MHDDAYAIEIDDLWKRYYLYSDKQATLKSAVLNRFRRTAGRQAFWALQGVTVRIRRGHTVGIIGNNGAGKSTLLRLLSGLGRPTRGRVRHNGRISTLLELGTGFNPDLSGRTNVYISAVVSGLTRAQVRRRLAEIVDFAELWDFIDAPVRTYSSGMFVRLAFATAINIDPDIIIVDEVLAVGDLRFQQKCLKRLRELKESGKTIVVVSHVMGHIEDLCDEVVWLDQGKVRAEGTATEVVAQYRNRLSTPRPSATPAPEAGLVGSVSATYSGAGGGGNGGTRTGVSGASSGDMGDVGDVEGVLAGGPTTPRVAQRTGDVYCEVTGVRLRDEAGAEADVIRCGGALLVDLAYRAYRPLSQPIVALGIFRDDGTKCYEATTEADNLHMEVALGEGALTVSFPELNLMRGSYYVDAGVYAAEWERTYDYHHRAATFVVEGDTPGSGVFLVPHQWSVL